MSNTQTTCLGDAIRMPSKKIPGENLLRHYALTKKIERDLMLRMPIGHSFVDVGAHNGDTVLAMALHARKVGRKDIRFVAFEPDVTKATFIENVAKLNHLDVKVYAFAIGDAEQTVRQTGDKPAKSGAVAYKAAESGLPMRTLDCFVEELSPVGHLHLDVEGWESKAIDGAERLLAGAEHCSLVAEAWHPNSAKKRGFSVTPLEDISRALAKHEHFRQQGYINDGNQNVLYSTHETSLASLVALYK